MTASIRTEVRKLVTTPALGVASGIAAVLAITAVVSTIALAGRPGTAPLGSIANVDKTLSVGALSSMVMLVLGIFVIGGEYRHRTIVTTFLSEPRRGRVIAAKLATTALLGAAVGFATFGIAVAVAVPLYASKGVHQLPVDIATMWTGATLSTMCFGVLGVALGVLTRNTIAAVLGSLIWLNIVEQAILHPLIPRLAKWFPASAAIAMTNSATAHDVLSVPGGAAVLIVWALVFALVATRFVTRADVR